jgi:PadR family transcriptional regulator, regulatory protein PadR
MQTGEFRKLTRMSQWVLVWLISRMPRHNERIPREAQLLQGTLDMLILKIAGLGPIHGYAIVQRLQQISRDALQIRQGSLYPALYRLENRGWLKSEWRTTEGGREAKYYSLTKAGRKQLQAETAGWNRLSEVISLVLETAE